MASFTCFKAGEDIRIALDMDCSHTWSIAHLAGDKGAQNQVKPGLICMGSNTLALTQARLCQTLDVDCTAYVA